MIFNTQQYENELSNIAWKQIFKALYQISFLNMTNVEKRVYLIFGEMHHIIIEKKS